MKGLEIITKATSAIEDLRRMYPEIEYINITFSDKEDSTFISVYGRKDGQKIFDEKFMEDKI